MNNLTCKMEKYFNIKVNQLVCSEFPNVKWSNEQVGKRFVINGLGVVYVSGLQVSSIKLDEPDYKFYFPFVKSLFQKAVRRQNEDVALKCCKYMMTIENGINQVIRRLLIIMVEDVTVFEKEFIILTYLTTQVDYDIHICNWLLGLVKCLCEYPSKIKVIGCCSKELDMAIKIRVSYGGLKCDIDMLKNIRSSEYQLNVKELNFKKIEILNKDDFKKSKNVFISAMDFHVSDIDKLISQKIPISIEDIRSIIWNNRSSVNTRETTELCSEDSNGVLKLFDELSYKKLAVYFTL